LSNGFLSLARREPTWDLAGNTYRHTTPLLDDLWRLTGADVDWHRGTISVKRQIQDIPGQGSVAGAPKTHSGARTILLGESTLTELRDQKIRVEDEANASGIWRENDLVFPSGVGTPFAKTDLQRDFWRLLKSANLPRIRFHDLRHTAASLMLGHGVPALVVSKILGHANASVTLTIYAHSTVDMQTEAAGIMDEIVTPIAVSILQLQPIATATDFPAFSTPHIWLNRTKIRSSDRIWCDRPGT
jgi:integrase